MSISYALPHHGMASEYQCSGVPYVVSITVDSTSVTKIHFPFVARHFTLLSSGTTVVRAGFTENGVNSNPAPHYIPVLPNTSTPRFEIKCQDIFLRNDSGTATNMVTIVAGLTNVTQDRFFSVTGSNGVEGVG